MNRKGFHAFFIVILFFLSLCTEYTLAADTEISGTVSLPNGVPASSEQKWFHVSLLTNWNGSYFSSSVGCGWLPLEANQRTAAYQCSSSEITGSFAVQIQTSDIDETYDFHIYNSTGTKFNSQDAELLASGNVYSDITIPLLKSVNISGTLQTPSGNTFAQDQLIFVNSHYRVTDIYGSHWNFSNGSGCTLPAGADRVAYSLKVPEIAGTVAIGYAWHSSPQPGYLRQGYYNSNGTDYTLNLATPIDTATPLTNIDMTILQGTLLNGTVHLPVGVTNSQDMTVDIRATNSDYTINENQTITIPSGQSLADFSFTLPPSQQVRLNYDAVNGADRPFISPGYYTPSGTTAVFWPPSWVPTNPPTEHIDLSLLPGVTISGTISLPNGLTYPNTITGSIQLLVDDNFYKSYQFAIHAGLTNDNWDFVIPQGTQNVTVQAYIYKWQYDPDPAYLDTSFFNSTGTVGLGENAELIDGSTDHPNTHITLLKGNILSGTANLASGGFPEGGNIYLSAYWENHEIGTSISVSSGESGGEYTISIPPDAPNYKLRYYQWGAPSSSLQQGYYNNSQSGYCESDAALFTSGVDHPNTNITLLQNHTIEGTIRLPDAATESVDIPISLGALYLPSEGQYATTLSGSYPKTVILPSMTNSIPYELSLPSACSETPGNYLIGYNQDNNNYVHFGYFHHSGTVGMISNSELLAPGESHTGINLELIRGNEISGTISLPNGAAAPAEGLPITLGTLQEPNGLYHTTVIIAPDATSVPYSIRVAPDVGNAALSYWLLGDTPFATRGYYSSTSTMASKVTGRYAAADQFASTASHENKDFILDYGNQISGSIYTPALAAEDVPIEITLAEDPADPATIYWQSTVNVSAGSQTAPYSRRIILDSDNVVAKYSNSHSPQWTPAGYYFDNMTSVRSLAQATRLAAGTDHSFIDLFLGELQRGDLNYDGVVDLTDAILGLQIMTGMSIADSISTSADVNGDGIISMPEVMHIMNQL